MRLIVLAVLAPSLFLLPFAARAQQPGKIYHIGHVTSADAGRWATIGALIGYGPSPEDLYRQAATHVDRIPKGAKPGDLPIGQPTTFELVCNLKTAKALGVTIPKSILLLADRVIQ